MSTLRGASRSSKFGDEIHVRTSTSSLRYIHVNILRGSDSHVGLSAKFTGVNKEALLPVIKYAPQGVGGEASRRE